MRLCGGRFGPASTPHDAGGAAHADSLVVDLGVAFSVPFSCGASHSHPGAPNASPFASQACGTVERFTAAYVFSLGIARGLNCAHWLLQLTSREASRALNVRDRFSLLWQQPGSTVASAAGSCRANPVSPRIALRIPCSQSYLLRSLSSLSLSRGPWGAALWPLMVVLSEIVQARQGVLLCARPPPPPPLSGSARSTLPSSFWLVD